MRRARPSTTAVLPTPGLADEDGVVLGAAREDLHDAADLLVAADHRIELLRPREGGEVPAVALEDAVLLLGGLVGDAPVAPHRLEGREDGVLGDALARGGARPRSPSPADDAEEDVLGRDVFVLEGRGLGLGLGDRRGGVGREVELRALAEDLGLLGEEGLGLGLDGSPIDADALEEGGHYPLLLPERARRRCSRSTWEWSRLRASAEASWMASWAFSVYLS